MSEVKRWLYASVAVGAAVLFATGVFVGTTCGGTPEGSMASGEHEGHAHGDAGTGAGEASGEVWTCSMHPDIRKDEPGQCPICGMDLIPAESGSESDESEPLAPNEVELSERARAMAQIRTTEVALKNPSGVTRRLLGRVKPAETRTRRLSAWTGGRLDALLVSEEGVEIRRGQKIAEIYSPEIYSAHRELLAARRQAERLGGGENDAGSAASRSASATLEAARRRLELLGIGPELMERMAEAERAWKQVPIRAQFGGTVTDLRVREGEYVDRGEVLYRLADLGEVWVEMDAYESDLSQIERGQTVEFSVPALPGRSYEGEVSFIDAVVDDASRTAQVRVVVDNRDGRLKPGMWVEAELFGGEAVPGGGEAGQVPVIPESAPLFAGERSIVYVEQPETSPARYAARTVKLGSKVGDMYPVIAGLSAGEKVVTNGAFVLDADLQIRGGRSMMARPDDADTGGMAGVITPSPELRDQLAEVFAGYFELRSALAEDAPERARRAIGSMRDHLEAVKPAHSDAEEKFRPIREAFQDALEGVESSESGGDLGGLREAFGALVGPMKSVLSVFGNPTGDSVRIAHCPMAFDGEGADWLQRGDEINNPYFGSEMLRCGSIKQTVGPGKYLMEDSDE